MKNLRSKKRMAMQVLGVGKNRVWLDPERLQDIKEAVTKQDIEALIKEKIIKKKPIVGNKKRAHGKRLERKRKGRRRGVGNRRKRIIHRKTDYILRIRKMRKYLKRIKTLVSKEEYAQLKKLVNGGEIREIKELKNRVGK